MRLERLLAILLYILKYKHVTAKELATKFEVTIRTIYRDIDALAQSGVPIISLQGNNGGYSIIDSYELNRLTFTKQEISYLVNTLSVNQHILAEKDSSILTDKIQHYQELLINEVKPTFTTGNISIHFDSVLELIQQRTEFIQDMMKNQQLMSIQYIDTYGIITKRLIYPLQIVYAIGTWYVYAYCTMRQAIRYFKISRMLEFQKGEQLGEKSVQEIQAYWDQFELNGQQEIQVVDKVILHFPKEILPHLYDYVMPEEIKLINHQEVEVIFQAIEKPTLDYFVRLFITSVEVVEPLWFREEVKMLIQEIINKYQT